METNTIRSHLCLAIGVLILGAHPSASTPRGQENALRFSCEVFSATTNAATLSARFGAANVKTAQVPWGGAEGDLSEGTVLFDTTADARLEIYWRDTTNKRNPEWVSVRGKKTRWRTPAGITLGTTLRRIEQVNGRPFRLVGFGSDVSGTVMNWSGGRLESQNTANCRVRMRVGPNWDKVTVQTSERINQLKGAPEYSAGHPAMQALSPVVYELFLQYARTPANTALEPPAHLEESMNALRLSANR